MAVLVNGERIEEAALRDEMDRMRPRYLQTFPDQTEEEQETRLREWARENLIERALLRQAAAADGRTIPADAVEERLREMRERHGGEEAFLSAYGLSPEALPEFRKELELQLRVERLVDDLSWDLPAPDEAQALRHYEDNPSDFTLPERVRAGHIVKHVDAETSPAEAEKIILEAKEKLDAGENFEDLASRHSDCPDDGGSLGWFPRGQMVPEFEDVVFAMQPGEVSGVFQTPFGFHIAKLYEHEAERPRPFAEVRDEVLKLVAAEARDRKLEEFLDVRKAEAAIEDIMEKPAASRKAGAIPGRRKSSRHRPPGRHDKVLRSVLVKPSGPDCNMRCRYCFYLEKETLFSETPTHRMSPKVLEAMVRGVMAGAAPQVNFGWQGGEPTLMGLDFFREAVALQRRYGQGRTVGNGFQTNGLLLNKEWADFFREHSFLVGLSLDGPRHVHDHDRLLAGGQGTWDKVSSAARLLLEHGVGTNALIVLTDHSARHAEEIYRYHKDLGLSFMQFIPCVETAPGEPTEAAPFSVSPEAYGSALCGLFDLWMGDFEEGRPTTSIRFFDSLFHTYVGLEPPECTLLEECGIYVVVEHNGDVYSCDFFVEPRWKLGNVETDDLTELLNSSRQRAFGRVKAALAEECRRCAWLPHCRGGCPKDRLGESGPPRVSHLCAGYQRFFEHADGRLRELADAWMRARNEIPPQAAANPEAPPSPPAAKAGRNDPCPCGSGLKFKKCCGQ